VYITHALSPHFSITDAIAADLTRIERARGFLEAATLSEPWIREMGRRALVLEAHHTTHIEGTRLTFDQAQKLWDGQNVPEADPDDAWELLNYRGAFDLVSDYLGSGRPVTEGLIREIHRRLVGGVRGGSALPGEYRRVQNYVANSATGNVVYTPPNPANVPELMTKLVEWLNQPGTTHPVLAGGIAQFQLVHIHPFIDGNGRTSRLLSTLCLYRAGYDIKRLFTISEYYDRDRTAFYRAIQNVREQGMDLTCWLEYFTHGLSTQLAEVKQRGELAIRRDVIVQERGLSERQAKAIGFLLEHDGLTIQDYEALCPDVNRRTLQRDLKDLTDKGLLIGQATSPTDPTKRYTLRNRGVQA
jgi:Fic family protein